MINHLKDLHVEFAFIIQLIFSMDSSCEYIFVYMSQCNVCDAMFAFAGVV